MGARQTVERSQLSEISSKGDVLCTQDDLATEFYIIVSGQCAVKVRGKNGAARRVSTLKALDFFGESGLVQGEHKRNATVVAESDFVQVLLLISRYLNGVYKHIVY